MSDIPLLETDRLVLRGFRPEDLDAMTAMWAMPDVVRYIGGVPLSREQSWGRLLRHIGMWRIMGFGFWAIIEKASGRLVGEAGFHEMRREMMPSIEDTLEAGWGLLPGSHGRGYASEALLPWAEVNHGGMPVTCIIDPANTASIRLAGRHGFREFSRSTYQGTEIILFRKATGILSGLQTKDSKQ
jgi:RimJ/RimL family protein N-acetyltransferase